MKWENLRNLINFFSCFNKSILHLNFLFFSWNLIIEARRLNWKFLNFRWIQNFSLRIRVGVAVAWKLEKLENQILQRQKEKKAKENFHRQNKVKKRRVELAWKLKEKKRKKKEEKWERKSKRRNLENN